MLSQSVYISRGTLNNCLVSVWRTTKWVARQRTRVYLAVATSVLTSSLTHTSTLSRSVTMTSSSSSQIAASGSTSRTTRPSKRCTRSATQSWRRRNCRTWRRATAHARTSASSSSASTRIKDHRLDASGQTTAQCRSMTSKRLRSTRSSDCWNSNESGRYQHRIRRCDRATGRCRDRVTGGTGGGCSTAQASQTLMRLRQTSWVTAVAALTPHSQATDR